MTQDHDIIAHKLFSVRLASREKLGGDAAMAISDALEERFHAIFLHNQEATDGDDWTVTLTTINAPDPAAVAGVIEEAAPGVFDHAKTAIEAMPERDWLTHVHEHFPPVTLGSFFIYGSHYDGAPPQNLIPLKIDAATAFGSGEHETTKGCLLALERLAAERGFKNGLDMGTGSGILAIAMRKLWPGIKLTAIDIDPESVTVTLRHAKMNGVENLAAEAGDGYASPLAGVNGPYDIVTANILAGPLIEMAEDLARALEKDGVAILSGLLQRQKNDVIAAHQALGFELVHAQDLGDWSALVLQKKGG